ncbi:restriction endonuclease [Thalassospira xianhensis]|uniref:Restriction endonuclease type IV Mrr domain-containing protein n=1 Tax=Thalassospira xianhensis MCCC 1A02616 TaxID=1177929 RepID=A0A367U8V0_9PROT|nr:restriction endonuclease [Thalassospira xianhensis]RCK04747.1 hypothetical protein TH5_17700 [Thalassospira xianhensis MCCC 1A02616]
MISEDKYLERIVAGIHSATSEGADVTWNEIIDDRQFDVTVRFQIGTMRYLVLVEVKNKNRKSSASEIEAFVTKTRDYNSNKSVFVTAAGFQSGAIKVAQKHGIELFTVKFNQEKFVLSEAQSHVLIRHRKAQTSEEMKIELGPPTPVEIITDIVLHYTSGKKAKLPQDPSQLEYYVANTVLSDGKTIDQVIREIPIDFDNSNGNESHLIKFPAPTFAKPIDDYFFPKGSIQSLEFKITRSMGHPIRGNTQIEPSAFSHPVVYKNALTNEEIELQLDQLPLGDKQLSIGKFYFQVHPLIYYYCNNITDDEQEMFIVESFQNRRLLTTQFRQHTKFSNRYIPVAHKPTIKRLERRLSDFKRNRHLD